MLTVLVVTGSLLKGAGKGVEYYIGSIDISKIKEPAVWKDATVQIFYALSTCQGGLIAMSSMNYFKNNILRDTLLVPLLDCLTGLYGGFAIFTVLGYMFESKCAASFSDVVAGGPELAFIVYPEGLSLMKVAPMWSILFFTMMIALGFGSEFSYMETIMIMFMDLFKKIINTNKKQIVARFIICLVFFLFSLCMTTQGGFFILSLINEYTAGYPLLIVGLLEVIFVSWVYGCSRFIEDTEKMIGKKPKWFWNICSFSWKFTCPIVLCVSK
jgi:SNF family Na+-dependent transporter